MPPLLLATSARDPPHPRARSRDRTAASAGGLVLRVERDPWTARGLVPKREAARAAALAARLDSHARVRVGERLSRRARASGARVRCRALVSAEVSADR